MGLFNKKKSGMKPTPQSIRYENHPFSLISAYNPCNTLEFALYKELREAVPIIDAAILKLTRLLGTFQVKCKNKRVEDNLKKFLRDVKVGGTDKGINSFLSTYFSELLTYGTAVGEIVAGNGGIYALFNASLDDVELRLQENGLDVAVCRRGIYRPDPIEHPERILLSTLNPVAGSIYGSSLLKGMPFVSGILLDIYKTIGTNFNRIGNLRFAVTYKPSSDNLDKATARERAEQIATEWANTMNCKNGQVRDFVSVGDVGIKVIGAEAQLPDTEIPVRHMLEQIIAKTGLPPFLLGLSWSTTERMSSQQTDILTSELEHYRRILEPIILKICDYWQEENGYFEDLSVEWDIINLQDEVELARARYYNSLADKAQAEALALSEKK
jgi:hypothetical protein